MNTVQTTESKMNIFFYHNDIPETLPASDKQQIRMENKSGELSDREVPIFMKSFLEDLLKKGHSFTIDKNASTGINEAINVTVTPSSIARSTKFLDLLAKIEFAIEVFNGDEVEMHIGNIGVLGKYLWRFLLGLNSRGAKITFVGLPVKVSKIINGLRPMNNVYTEYQRFYPNMNKEVAKESTSPSILKQTVIGGTEPVTEAPVKKKKPTATKKKEVVESIQEEVKETVDEKPFTKAEHQASLDKEVPVAEKVVKKTTRKTAAKKEAPVMEETDVEEKVAPVAKKKKPVAKPVLASEDKLAELAGKFTTKQKQSA